MHRQSVLHGVLCSTPVTLNPEFWQGDQTLKQGRGEGPFEIKHVDPPMQNILQNQGQSKQLNSLHVHAWVTWQSNGKFRGSMEGIGHLQALPHLVSTT